MRARLLGVPMLPPVNLEAGYGAALLARTDPREAGAPGRVGGVLRRARPRPEQMQTAGENTSLKEGGRSWVKASGRAR